MSEKENFELSDFVMREVDAGVLRKSMTSETALDEKTQKFLKILKAIDYIFEPILNKYDPSLSYSPGKLTESIGLLAEGVEEGFVDFEVLIEGIVDRYQSAEGALIGSKAIPEDNLKGFIDCLCIPREDLPLYISSNNSLVQKVVRARLRGPDVYIKGIEKIVLKLRDKDELLADIADYKERETELMKICENYVNGISNPEDEHKLILGVREFINRNLKRA
jgi:hypothetical protein